MKFERNSSRHKHQVKVAVHFKILVNIGKFFKKKEMLKRERRAHIDVGEVKMLERSELLEIRVFKRKQTETIVEHQGFQIRRK